MKLGDPDEIKRQVAAIGREYRKEGDWRQWMLCRRLVRKLEQIPPVKRDMVADTTELVDADQFWGTCAKCGALVENDRFCSHCGRRIVKQGGA